MYGLIAKLRTNPDMRDAALAILTREVGVLPGCLAYVVARDPTDPDIVWITEVWQDRASHDEALALPAVRAAIADAQPLIAGFETSIPIEPVGAFDLRQQRRNTEPAE